MEEQILTEEQTRRNRENFKKRLKDEGRLENPFAPKEPQKTRKEFHGFQ